MLFYHFVVILFFLVSTSVYSAGNFINQQVKLPQQAAISSRISQKSPILNNLSQQAAINSNLSNQKGKIKDAAESATANLIQSAAGIATQALGAWMNGKVNQPQQQQNGKFTQNPANNIQKILPNSQNQVNGIVKNISTNTSKLPNNNLVITKNINTYPQQLPVKTISLPNTNQKQPRTITYTGANVQQLSSKTSPYYNIPATASTRTVALPKK